MKRLIIIGASAMGRETCRYAEECGMEVKGFLDSRPNVLDDYKNYPIILGAAEEYSVSAEDMFVCAVGDAEQRRKYVKVIEGKGGRFISIVHPKAYVGKNVVIGDGCIICPNATLTSDITVGCHVIVNVNSSISHDCKIDDFVTLSPGCNIAGWCEVGADAFLGVHSAIIPHIKLESGGVFVAAGAVVTKSVALGRVMGIPARPK